MKLLWTYLLANSLCLTIVQTASSRYCKRLAKFICYIYLFFFILLISNYLTVSSLISHGRVYQTNSAARIASSRSYPKIRSIKTTDIYDLVSYWTQKSFVCKKQNNLKVSFQARKVKELWPHHLCVYIYVSIWETWSFAVHPKINSTSSLFFFSFVLGWLRTLGFTLFQHSANLTKLLAYEIFLVLFRDWSWLWELYRIKKENKRVHMQVNLRRKARLNSNWNKFRLKKKRTLKIKG